MINFRDTCSRQNERIQVEHLFLIHYFIAPFLKNILYLKFNKKITCCNYNDNLIIFL